MSKTVNMCTGAECGGTLSMTFWMENAFPFPDLNIYFGKGLVATLVPVATVLYFLKKSASTLNILVY